MKPVCSEPEAIERLYPRCQMHVLLLLIEHSTCLQNPSQSCATSSACSLMRTRLSWTPHAEVVAPCERLSRLVRHIYSELNSTRSSPTEQPKP